MAILNRIKFDGLRSRDWIIYKHPTDKITAGSQLIVTEGQLAIFVKGGQLCDVFYPGTYTLSTNNLPILQSLVNLPFGGETPFSAEIFYINTTTRLSMNWGTTDPIQLIDPKYQIRMRVRAFGQFGLKIKDATTFFKELIGAMNQDEIISYDRVLEFYRGLLITKLKTIIADTIINNKISVLDVSTQLDKVSEVAKEKVSEEFDRFGLEVVNFFIESINFPKDDFDKINEILQDRAAFEIMGDARYATKRSFDVYEGAANNESGVAGAFAAGGIGLAAGANLVNHSSGVVKPVLDTASGEAKTCPKCHSIIANNAKFCQSCGTPLQEEKIICYKCKAENNNGAKFCCECGANLQNRVCECGNMIKPGDKFCSECGKKVE